MRLQVIVLRSAVIPQQAAARRGQFIIEFIMILAMAVLVGVLYLAVSGAYFSEVGDRQRRQSLDDLGYQLQDELILAASVNDGYTRNLTLPASVGRFPYSVTNDATSITLSSGRLILGYELPAFSGTFQKGKNVISKQGNIMVVPG